MEIMLERLKHYLKRPSILLFLVGPLIGTILIGGLIQKQQQELAIPIAIVDQDQTKLSKTIVNRLKQHTKLSVYQTSEKIADEMLEKAEIDSAYVLRKDLQKNLIRENREGIIEVKSTSSTIASAFVQEVLGSEATRISSSIKAANQVLRMDKLKELDKISKGSLWEEAYDYTDDQWEPQPLMTIDYREVSMNNTDTISDSKDNDFKPFIGIWCFFTLISCFLLTDWIIKEKHLYKRVRSTYAGIPSYFLQTTTMTILLQVVQSTISLVLLSSFHLIELDLMLFIAMLSVVFFCIGGASFSASLIKHLGSYYVFGILVSLILAVFSGSFFPIGELLGKYQFLIHLLPQSLLTQMDYSTLKLLYPFMTGILLLGFSIGRVIINDND